MSVSPQKRSSRDNEPIQCFLRVSIGGEILAEDIVIELDIQNRPKTCESFLSLCDDSTNTPRDSNDSTKRGIHRPVRTNRQSPQPTYRGCEFHRVVPGFCVQTGDWERFDGTGGYSPLYGRNWKDEEGGGKNINKHDREGIVSMANAGKPNTNGSQFFVTLKSTPHLDGKHTVFGRVISGMESVRKMVDVERGEKDRPVSLQRIVIEDCGRFSLRQKQTSKESDKEYGIRRKSKSKKHRREKKSKKAKKKKHRYRRDESSASDSDSSDNSSGDDDNDDAERTKDHRREKHSRRHRQRKRRRKNYKTQDRSDDDDSSDSSTNDDSSISDRKRRRRRSSRDENNRSDRKARSHEKKGRKGDKRRRDR